MVHALIQARMSSTRLPGKVLLKIEDKPLLWYIAERVSKARLVDKTVVVTSTDASDDPIVDFCKKEGIICCRGSLDDVLDRYYQSAVSLGASAIVRLTADCPLMDPEIIDWVVSAFKVGNYDYASNTTPPETTTFPDGMDVEVFSFSALQRAHQEAKKPSDREHVTFYLWQNGEAFSTYRVDLKENLSQYRFTVDYPEDIEVIRSIINHLTVTKPDFHMRDIIELVRKNPDIMTPNSQKKRNSGWQSAFEKDKKMGY